MRSSDSPDRYAALPVGGFLDALAAGKPAPAGGSAIALVLAQAGALCAKSARLSARQLTADRAELLTVQAERIRAAAASLIDDDPRAYAAVIERRRQAAAAKSPADEPRDSGTSRPAAGVAVALSGAAEVPMRMVELAVPLTDLAAALAAGGNPALRGDAVAAALLAQAAARSAATLVSINLASSPADTRPARAAGLLAAIARTLDTLPLPSVSG